MNEIDDPEVDDQNGFIEVVILGFGVLIVSVVIVSIVFGMGHEIKIIIEQLF